MTPFDPMALPGPPGLFQALLEVTFVLHLAALGLLAAALWGCAGAEWSRDRVHAISALHRSSVLGFSVTITAGVPPLLFVQLLYGKYFYASSITLGWAWLAIVGYLMAGFYALYLWRWQWDRIGGPSILSKLLLLVTVTAVAAVGFTFSRNHLMSLSPTPWINHVAFVAVLQRLTGYVAAVLIASGAWASWFGQSWRRDRGLPHGTGVALLAGGILGFVWVGAWLPDGGHGSNLAHLLLSTGLGLSLAAGVFALMQKTFLLRIIILPASLATLTGMSIQRESYRLAVLAGDVEGVLGPVRPQWGPMVMFLVALAVGLATLGWMLSRIIGAGRLRDRTNDTNT